MHDKQRPPNVKLSEAIQQATQIVQLLLWTVQFGRPAAQFFQQVAGTFINIIFGQHILLCPEPRRLGCGHDPTGSRPSPLPVSDAESPCACSLCSCVAASFIARSPSRIASIASACRPRAAPLSPCSNASAASSMARCACSSASSAASPSGMPSPGKGCNCCWRKASASSR